MLCALGVFLGVFAVKTATAQNDVQINISVLPPYSAYIQDYAGAGKQVQIFVRNTTATRLQVRLQGSVTGDNGVQIQTVPNYRPPVPLTLEPFQNRLLSYADLSGLFDLNQLDVQGVDRNSLYRGLPLPEGSYQLCIRAFDNATSRPLSPENPLGCSPPFPIKAVEPPILISPFCDSDIQPLTPQNIVFTWTPPIGVSPAMVDYTLRIVELPLASSDPNVFIDAVVLPKSGVEVRGLKTSTFLYSVVQPQLIPGKKYAWRVQARDISGRTNFLNDGKSPVCSFQYGPVLSAGLDSSKMQGPIVTKSDKSTYAVRVACQDGPGAGQVKVGKLGGGYVSGVTTATAGNGVKLAISWSPDPKFLLLLAQKMGFNTDSAGIRSAVQQIPGAGYELTVIEKSTGKTVWVPPLTTKEFVSGDPDEPDFPLAYGNIYQYHVRLVLPDNVLNKTGLPGDWKLTSPSCSFLLKKVPKAGAGFLVRGQIRYKFDREDLPTTYPANNTDVKISFTLKARSSEQATYYAGQNGPTGASAKPLTPQQKLAALGGSKPAPAKSSSGSASKAPAPTGDLPFTYYAKTDAEGNYELPIPWEDLPLLLPSGKVVGKAAAKTQNEDGTVTASAADLIALNYQLDLPSGYYQNTTEVRSFTYSPTSVSVSAGAATVNVYAYTLRVNVAKDYNSAYKLTNQSGQTASQKNANQVSIDQTIMKPVAGVQMDLYRKTKGPGGLDGIPAVEGQIGEKELPASSGYRYIATGKTALVTAANGTQQALVTFERLICNANAGDEYFLQARPSQKDSIAASKVLMDKTGKKPTGDYTTSDSTAKYAAPEDTVFFAVPAYKSFIGKVYYTHKTTYLLRSLLPPTSRISGRLLYQWPGKPDKFVMANMPFRVKIGYVTTGATTDGGKLSNGIITQKVAIVLGEINYTDSTGKKHPLSMDDRDFVAGTGKTDANGNFTLDVVNLNYKGTLTNSATVTQGTLTMEDPGKDGVSNPKYNGPGGQIQLLKDQGYPTDYINMGDLQGTDYTNGIQTVINAQQTATTTQQISGVKLPGGAAKKQAAKAAGGGPFDDDEVARQFFPLDPEPLLVQAGDVYQSVYRCFIIEPEATQYYTSFNNVVVQAFETQNLGELLVNVKPYTRKLRVQWAGDKKAVQNARVILFRENSKGMDHLPEQEGDGNERFDKLPVSSYTQAMPPYPDGRPFPGTDAVKYYAEGFTNEKGELLFNNKAKRPVPNLLLNGDYRCYILPTEAALSYFPASLTTLSTVPAFVNPEEGIDDSYDDKLVAAGPSRLIVRLVDSTTTKGLKGAVELYEYKDDKCQVKPPHTIFGYKDGDPSSGPALVDQTGYREFSLGMYYSDNGWKEDATKYFRIDARVPGYKLVDGKTQTCYPVKRTGTSFLINLKFLPGTILRGVVKGRKVIADQKEGYKETSEIVGLPAIIRRTVDDKVFFTEDSPVGSFSIAVAAATDKVPTQTIIIEPNDPGYWSDTLVLSGLKMNEDKTLPQSPIMLARVKHRMRFVVQGLTADGTPLPDELFQVKINDRKPVEGSLTKPADDEFENVSVDHYTVKVWSKKPNSDWIPQLFEVKNKESKGWTVYTVKMKLGGRITGTVTLDGKPVGDAKVYLDYQMSGNATPPEAVTGGSTGPADQNTGETLIQTYSSTGVINLNGQTANNGTKKGEFTLRGLPLTDGIVKIRATLDGTGSTVIGAEASVQLKGGSGTATLNLTTYSGALVQSIYGFPLSVEKMAIKPNGTVTVTGQLNLKKSRSGFAWLPTGDVARVRDVPIRGIDVGGKKVATPVADNVVLDEVASLKFRYIGAYNVLARHPDYVAGSAPDPLTLSKDQSGRGVLLGKVQIVDNSFNYPSTYLTFAKKGDENFYLAQAVKEGNAGAKINQRVTVLTALSTDAAFDPNTATPSVPEKVKYNLCDQMGGPVSFSLLQFPTDADPIGSYIDPDDKKIHLAANLTCKIPNAQPENFTVHIDDLVLDDKQVYPKKGSKPLELRFENWTLNVSDWTLDVKEGGITRKPQTPDKSIVLKTGAVDIPFAEFILRHDLFALRKPQLKSLDVGSIATLRTQNDQNALFTYDVGFDGQGHWKLAMFGSGDQPAGTLEIDKAGADRYLLKSEKLSEKTNNTVVNFEYIQLLSNDQNILSISPRQTFTVKGNPLASFEPMGFVSGVGSMELKGKFALKDAPRTPGAEMSINYTKGKTGTYSPLGDWQAELLGNVKFRATAPGNDNSNLSITEKQIVIKGVAQEDGESPPVNVYFCGRATDTYPYWIQVLPQKVKMAQYTVDVLGTVGAQAKLGQDWDAPMQFIGKLYETNQTGASLKKSDWYTQFTIFGDLHVTDFNNDKVKLDGLTSKGGTLEADKNGNFKVDKLPLFGEGSNTAIDNKGIDMSGIKTPMGAVALKLTFSPFSLAGSIDISDKGQPIEMGVFKVRGQGSMLIDSEGAYLVASLMGQSDQLPPPIQGVSMGIAVGKRKTYKPEAVAILMGTSKDPMLPCKINEAKGISGFFLGGGVTVLHKEIGFDAIVAEAWAMADVSLFASTEFTIGNDATLTFGAGAVATGEIGARILCASASARAQVFADMNATMNFTSPSVCLNGMLGAFFEVKVDACGLLDGVNIGKQLAVSAVISSGKDPDFDFVNQNKDGGGKACMLPKTCDCPK